MATQVDCQHVNFTVLFEEEDMFGSLVNRLGNVVVSMDVLPTISSMMSKTTQYRTYRSFDANEKLEICSTFEPKISHLMLAALFEAPITPVLIDVLARQLPKAAMKPAFIAGGVISDKSKPFFRPMWFFDLRYDEEQFYLPQNRPPINFLLIGFKTERCRNIKGHPRLSVYPTVSSFWWPNHVTAMGPRVKASSDRELAMPSLPMDVWIRIFELLSLKDKLACSGVSRLWRGLMRTPQLWCDLDLFALSYRLNRSVVRFLIDRAALVRNLRMPSLLPSLEIFHQVSLFRAINHGQLTSLSLGFADEAVLKLVSRTQPNLQVLEIANLSSSVEPLETILEFRKLEKLFLYVDTRISIEHLDACSFFDNLPRLELLGISIGFHSVFQDNPDHLQALVDGFVNWAVRSSTLLRFFKFSFYDFERGSFIFHFEPESLRKILTAAPNLEEFSINCHSFLETFSSRDAGFIIVEAIYPNTLAELCPKIRKLPTLQFHSTRLLLETPGKLARICQGLCDVATVDICGVAKEAQSFVAELDRLNCDSKFIARIVVRDYSSSLSGQEQYFWTIDYPRLNFLFLDADFS